MAERLVVDQALCNKVWKLTQKKMETKEIVEILGISQSTVSRIQTADYNAEQFKKMTELRRKAQQDKRKAQEQLSKMEKYMEDNSTLQPEPTEEWPAKIQEIEGQMKMDLPDPVTEKPAEEQNKIIRFLAGQFDKTNMKIEMLNDTLSQILRVIRKE